MSQAKIQVMQHQETGLLTAFSADLPGFIVHAHDDAELRSKLGPALKDFVGAPGELPEQL